MDITDLTTILEAIKRYKVTSIVHGVSVREGRAKLYQTVAVNVTGSANVFRSSQTDGCWPGYLSQLRSCLSGPQGYDSTEGRRIRLGQVDRYTPVIKKMAEHLFFIYQKDYKMDVVINTVVQDIRSRLPSGTADHADDRRGSKGADSQISMTSTRMRAMIFFTFVIVPGPLR